MKSIEIIISPTGATTVQTKGFAGAGCREATRLIEQALGQVQSDKPTTEMYQDASRKEQIRQQTQ